MKGGITSGVVYPKAIAKLATRFTFKNVGGTSAGAIAAAAAAAAECRRVRTGDEAGFAMLDKLGDDLATTPKGSKNTMLFSLFAPNGTTKRVFEVLTAPLGKESTSAMALVTLGRAIRRYWLAAIVGMAPGADLMILSFYLSYSHDLRSVWMTVGLVLAIAGGLAAVGFALLREFVMEVPDNNFGLCSGMPDAGSKPSGLEPLTVWLNGYLNKVAGIEGERPLVFRDLWDPSGNAVVGSDREVNLEMMTTNLTHGRPYRLPFRYDDDLKENNLFYFRKDEFELLFPGPVVDWMIDHPRAIEPGSDPSGKRSLARSARAAVGYYPLPDPGDLPVVVATRMSLSFPVLLSVIPLHAIDYTKKDPQLERCWFTDGGVCSNFPLHFFDGPLPRRPTFSIDLTEKPNGTDQKVLVPEMDETNLFSPVDRWNRFDLDVSADGSSKAKGSFGQLMGFAGTLISTMQNWNDATQSRLPGYRDRIVRIPLTPKQGGLNLNMPPDLVTFLSGQGTACADKLIEHFDVPPIDPTMNWENHRWIRIRSMLAAFEKMADQTLSACDGPENEDVSFETWLSELAADKTGKHEKLSYEASKPQLEAALKTIDKLRQLKATWDDAGTAAKNSPRPRPLMPPAGTDIGDS